MQSARSIAVFLMTMLAVASVVSACGRKGNLEEPPSSATRVETDELGRPIGEETVTKDGKRKIRDRPFILDGLI